MSASSHPSLPPSSRRRIENGLRELLQWRDRARDDYQGRAATASRDEQRSMRQLVDDLEWLCYRLEQVLHPAGPPPRRSTERPQRTDDEPGGES